MRLNWKKLQQILPLPADGVKVRSALAATTGLDTKIDAGIDQQPEEISRTRRKVPDVQET